MKFRFNDLKRSSDFLVDEKRNFSRKGKSWENFQQTLKNVRNRGKSAETEGKCIIGFGRMDTSACMVVVDALDTVHLKFLL